MLNSSLESVIKSCDLYWYASLGKSHQYLLDLIIHAVKKNLKFQLLPPKILGKDLWNLISMCVLQPSAVGFNLGDVEIIKNLPTEVEQLLTIHMIV